MIVKNEDGLTLIELIIVVVLLGILSTFAAVKLSGNLTSTQAGAAAKKMASDIRYAQQLAQSEGTETRFYIDQANNRYYIKWENGTDVPHPTGGGAFVVEFGIGDFSQVEIISSALSAARLDFTRRGYPLNGGSSFSGEISVVNLNNEKQILVTANTGFLKVENL